MPDPRSQSDTEPVVGADWRLMRALVTGGAGFIGSAIAQALLRRGHDVRIIDNLAAGFSSNIPGDAEFAEADIRDLGAIERACRDVEIVFHQAAFKSVPKSIDDPLAAETSNGLGTLNVLTASAKAGVRRVIYASSSSVYGEADGIKDETLPTLPISPYGVSKLTGEHYCRIWPRVQGLSTVCLRYFNVFGPGQRADSQYAAVIPAFVSALNGGQAATIHGDGNQTRDFTFIDDVVRANLLAMEAGPEVGGCVMNVCAGKPKSVNDLHAEVASATGTSIPPRYVDRRPGDILHSHGDISKAYSLLGWAPEANWSDSIRATVDWFSSGGHIINESSRLRSEATRG